MSTIISSSKQESSAYQCRLGSGRDAVVPGVVRPVAVAMVAATAGNAATGGGGGGVVLREAVGELVRRRSVGLEEAVAALRCRPGLHVLVEEREHIDAQRRRRPHRRALPLGHEPHHIAVVPRRVLRRGAGLVGVPRRRPPGLGHAHLHGPRRRAVGRRDGMVHGVDLRREHVGVVQPGPRVGDAGMAGFQQRILELHARGFLGVGEVGVRIDQERRPRVRVEVEDGAEHREEVLAEVGRRRRVRRGQHAEVVRRGDGDLLVQAGLRKRVVEALHRREEVPGKRGAVDAGEHLVADGEEGDLGGRERGGNVGADPGGGAVGGGDSGKALVRDADDELDARVGEGADGGGVSIVESDAADAQGGHNLRH